MDQAEQHFRHRALRLQLGPDRPASRQNFTLQVTKIMATCIFLCAYSHICAVFFRSIFKKLVFEMCLFLVAKCASHLRGRRATAASNKSATTLITSIIHMYELPPLCNRFICNNNAGSYLAMTPSPSAKRLTHLENAPTAPGVLVSSFFWF